jgi:hypothetical protein
MNRPSTALGALLGLALLLAACQEQPTEPVPTGTASLSYTPPAYQSAPHPFVGQVVNVVLISVDPVFHCLDVAGGLANVGDFVQVYPCHNGLNQQWRIEAAPLSAGSLATHDLRILRRRQDLVMLRSMKNPNVCLDVANATANGNENLVVFNCHGERNQAFALPRPGGANFTVGAIKTEVSGFTMALDAGSATDRWVRQKPLAEFTRQDWAFQPAGTGNRL